MYGRVCVLPHPLSQHCCRFYADRQPDVLKRTAVPTFLVEVLGAHIRVSAVYWTTDL